MSRSTTVHDALGRLRAGADLARLWPATTWHRVAGPGPDTLELTHGAFPQLVLEPGRETVLETAVAAPASLPAEIVEGQPLELTVNTLYPAAVEVDGRSLLDEPLPLVAPGPALLEVTPRLDGTGGTLRLTLRPPAHQLTPWWVWLQFSTPALRERFLLLDATWARLTVADELAADDADDAALEAAGRLIPDDVTTLDRAGVDRLHEATVDALSRFDERARELRVHLIGHCHIDLNWLWTWDDTRAIILRDLRSAADIMDDYPEFTFTHSQPAAYDVVRREDPELFARIVELIGRGRWEAATARWVEGDTNMASGEAHARQVLEGVGFSREHLGVQPRVVLEPDTFGHAGNLPQILRSAGARYYYHHRANPGGHEPWPAYWWEGDDGSRLLALSTRSYNGEITAGGIANAAIAARRAGLPAGLLFHGVGDHGGGPTRRGLDVRRRLDGQPGLPAAVCSTLERHGDLIVSSGAALPVHRGESPTIFEGCYTTHADTKRYNRAGENLLCTADALSALAGTGDDAALREAWRSVCFNQFHDILDGSAINEVYQEQADDFARIRTTAETAIETALDELGGGDGLTVTNPLGWDREDIVVVHGLVVDAPVRLTGAHGHQTVGQPTPDGLCFVARIGAYETVAYEVQPQGEPVEPLDVQEVGPPIGRGAAGLAAGSDAGRSRYVRVRTPLYEAHVRRDCGVLVSLRDLRTGRDLVGYGMRRPSDYIDAARPDLALGVLQLVEEHDHGMSAWHLDEVFRETSLISGASTEVVESGPVRVVVEARHTVAASTVTQRFVFYRDLDRIDLHTLIDWREVGSAERGVPNLKASFTARLDGCEAWFETPFGAVSRPPDGQEVPALRWAAVEGASQGFAVLNDAKYGYDALGTRLRLNLVRSAYNPDPVSDVGLHDVRYALLPYLGSWQDAGVVGAAAGFNQPLLARRSSGAPGSHTTWRPVVDDPSVLISGIKRPANGDGRIIRLYESAGRTTQARILGLPPGASVRETTVVEDPLRRLDAGGGELRLDFRPFQVRTLLVTEHDA